MIRTCKLPGSLRQISASSCHGRQRRERNRRLVSFAMKSTRQYRGIPILARLRTGATLSEANAELQDDRVSVSSRNIRCIMRRYRMASSSTRRELSTDSGYSGAAPGAVTRDARPKLICLASVVGFVLLLACANVANLYVPEARFDSGNLRSAPRWCAGSVRISRQLLTEISCSRSYLHALV